MHRPFQPFLLPFMFIALFISGCGNSGNVNKITSVTTTTPGIYFASGMVFRNSTTLSWGYNGNGQVGNGSTNGNNVTSPVPILSGFNGFAIGSNHSLVFKNMSGGVLASGSNGYYQLGLGSNRGTNPIASPDYVKTDDQGTHLIHVTAIAAGKNHNLALLNDGTVWSWGANYSGQLGIGSTSNSGLAVQISGLSNIVEIAAGSDFSLALDSNGNVWGWGSNSKGQLGITPPSTSDYRASPVPINGANGLPLTGIKHIAAGGAFGLAINASDKVLSWGSNEFGQLGPLSDPVPTFSITPQEVPGLQNITKISAGIAHSLAISGDPNSGNATLYSWGYDGYGQLGTGSERGRTIQQVPDQTPYPIPTAVALGGTVSDVRAVGHQSFAIDNSGKLWAWGSNGFSQLGDGGTTSRNIPEIIISSGCSFQR